MRRHVTELLDSAIDGGPAAKILNIFEQSPNQLRSEQTGANKEKAANA